MKYVISACLAGITCRYDGFSNSNDTVLRLARSGSAVLVCPELLGGLSVPRTPCEILHDRVYDNHGSDKTQNFERGALKALNIALSHGCARALLKARSPSCGYGCVYDGTFHHVLTPGCGFYAALLEKAGIKIFTEENIRAFLDTL